MQSCINNHTVIKSLSITKYFNACMSLDRTFTLLCNRIHSNACMLHLISIPVQQQRDSIDCCEVLSSSLNSHYCFNLYLNEFGNTKVRHLFFFNRNPFYLFSFRTIYRKLFDFGHAISKINFTLRFLLRINNTVSAKYSFCL